MAAGENVKYTVPMKVRKDNVGKMLEVSFRVKKIFNENSVVTVTQGDKQIARFKRPYMSSSKMEKVKVPLKLLQDVKAEDGPVTISAVETDA